MDRRIAAQLTGWDGWLALGVVRGSLAPWRWEFSAQRRKGPL